MGWKEIDDKTKKGIDSEFVSCTEEWEMNYVKTVIKEEFPYFSEDMIRNSIESVCKETAAPRPR